MHFNDDVMDSILFKEREQEQRRMNIEEQLASYFRERSGAEVAVDTKLIEGGFIDSMGIQELIAFIESVYAFELDMEEITVENSGTINDIRKLILNKRGEA